MGIIHDKINKEFVLPMENGTKAKVSYVLDNASEMRLVHSEVPLALRGKGIGKELVLKTFEQLTEEGYRAKAVCGYVRHIAKRDPKWSGIIG
ncbi:GNAT family N-acetyltransferase [Niabella ginsengisoli]|uniref:N-acetyltransferase n=1 Tax=Niabella ginsengisoli TaxID=522298 RepID=A0ABS9SKN3_9BACT|nr:GNAT family N-acetyltransferase [Niabella ginsengisoli]MCH5598923.1 N-acetyltransferase [Niabella ginsengisoli]